MIQEKIGILGGGQLGRMLIQSAISLDLEIHILDPDENAPCKYLTPYFRKGAITDFQTVYDFGKELDIITIEIENVNIEALEKLEKEGKKIYPQPHIIKTIQDKGLQKQFYAAHNIPSPEFILIHQKEELDQHLDFFPAFMKLRKEGYDGRGVVRINGKEDFGKAFDKPSLIEKLADIEKEIAVIIARNADGQIEIFPATELVFNPVYNLVDCLLAPAQISEELTQKANHLAVKVITELDMVGILAIEMFLTKEGSLLVNEIAPRPHNSGHHSIEANITSQFEQHLRAITNLPLGSTETKMMAGMVNLIGEEGYQGNARYEGLEDIMEIAGVSVHLYGKKTTKPSRKMGHITILDNDINSLQNKIHQVKKGIKVVSY